MAKIREFAGLMVKDREQDTTRQAVNSAKGEKQAMNVDRDWRFRLAVISALVKKAPQKPGRTALMKFAYILQTVGGVPLGYSFELYNYGPYDTTVLSDLSQAATLKAIRSETFSETISKLKSKNLITVA